MSNEIKVLNQTMSSSQLLEMLHFESISSLNKAIRTMFAQEIDDSNLESSLDERGYVKEYFLPEVESKMFVAKHNINYLRKITEYWVSKNNISINQLKEQIKQELIDDGLIKKPRKNKPKAIGNIIVLDRKIVLKVKVNNKLLHLGYFSSEEEREEWKSEFRKFLNVTDEIDIYEIRNAFYIKMTGQKYKPYLHKYKHKKSRLAS